VHQFDASTVVVTRYADIKAVYLDAEHFPVETERGVRFAGKLDLLSDEERALQEENLAFERMFTTNLNGAEHRRVRSAVRGAFTPRRVAELGESVDQLVDELLTRYAGDTFDFMEIARQLPIYVIMDLLGAPRSDAAMLKQWGDELNTVRTQLPPEVVRTAHAALQQFRAYVGELIARHRAGGDVKGVVADLLSAEQNEQISDDEVAATFVHLLFAGHETTTNLIGNAMLQLLRYPSEWERLRTDPTLAGSCVEEVLRFDPSVQFFQRKAGEDATIADSEVEPGTAVILLNASANRDPAAFDDPDRFDITRSPNYQLAFGHGIHFCLGAQVARLEARALVQALATRFPDLQAEVPLDTVRIFPNVNLRGPESLPLNLGPERAAN
jgi:cytochrome P450